MAKNKKAQILAAVMCAATVAGVSPAISSAADIADIIRDENNTASVITKDGAITGVADNLTFTVGDNKFSMQNGEYGYTELAYGPASVYVGTNGLTLSNGTSLAVTADGTKFYSADGSTTTINGNSITTKNLNATNADLEELYVDGGNGSLYVGQSGVTAANGNTFMSVEKDGLKVFNNGTNEATVITGDSVTTKNLNATNADLDELYVDGGNGSLYVGQSGVTAANGNTFMSVEKDGLKVSNSGTNEATMIDGNSVTTDKLNASGADLEELYVDGGNGALYAGANGITATNGDTYMSVENDGLKVFNNGTSEATVITGNSIATTDLNATNVNVTNGDVTSTTANGNVYSLNEIGRNVSGIYSDGQGATTIQGYTTITENGITTNNITTDSLTVNGVSIGDGSVHVNDEFIAQNGHKQIYLGDSGLTLQNEGTFVSVEEDGTSFKDANGTETKINGGNITTNRVDVNGEFTATNGDKMFYVGDNGITARNGDTFVSVGNDGLKIAQNGTNDYTTINGSTISTSTGTLTVDGDVTSTENGNVYSLNEIGRNTTAIYSDGQGVTTIEGYTTIDKNGVVTANDFVVDGMSLGGLAGSIGNISPEGNISNIGGIRRDNQDFAAPGEASTNIEQSTTISKDGVNVKVDNTQTIIDKDGVTTDGAFTSKNDSGSSTIDGGKITVTGGTNGETTTIDGGSIVTDSITAGQINGVGIGKDENGNTIINGTNLGELATDTTVTEKVNAAVGDTTKLNDDIKGSQEYKDNKSLVGAINAESAMREQLGKDVKALDGRVSNLEDRMGDVEDRIDKVGAMAAAIANLRTMGYDPEAPTEIAVGVGQYESETGLALGVFHYPNQDFMLSASISTSGDEVMGGIGATWKIGRKSATEKERTVEEKRVEKAEEMQDLAKKERVNAQRERHAKMLAERQQQEA